MELVEALSFLGPRKMACFYLVYVENSKSTCGSETRVLSPQKCFCSQSGAVQCDFGEFQRTDKHGR